MNFPGMLYILLEELLEETSKGSDPSILLFAWWQSLQGPQEGRLLQGTLVYLLQVI
jgi:hypothetical protein